MVPPWLKITEVFFSCQALRYLIEFTIVHLIVMFNDYIMPK
jgi:hypothetical protein